MEDDAIKSLRQEVRYVRNRVDDIYTFMSIDRERITKIEANVKDNTKEIDKHLDNHWRIIGIIMVFFTAIIGYLAVV